MKSNKPRKPTKRHKLLTKSKDLAEFREADKIISYLENPDGPNKLPVILKNKLDRYAAVNQLKMRYKTNSHIVGHLKEFYGRNERQARYDIAETEYIFGKALKINIAFENNFLLEASRKNIELAFLSKDTVKISKALETHKKIVGDEPDLSLIPDFSKFEPHQYNIVVPPEVIQLFMDLMAQGAINLSKLIPSKMLEQTMDDIEYAREVKDGE